MIHEANLHHLIADLTIKRGDWDAYMRAVAAGGDQAALEYAQRVRALEVGPDYDGLPMLRRLLSRSKAAIVHSAHGGIGTCGAPASMGRLREFRMAPGSRKPTARTSVTA